MPSFFSVCYGCFWFQKKYVYPLDYKQEVFSSAKEFNLNKALVYAVIKTESSFNKNAVSEKNAIGLMQITKSTAQFIASKLGLSEYNLYNPSDNVRFGCFYLRYLLDKF